MKKEEKIKDRFLAAMMSAIPNIEWTTPEALYGPPRGLDLTIGIINMLGWFAGLIIVPITVLIGMIVFFKKSTLSIGKKIIIGIVSALGTGICVFLIPLILKGIYIFIENIIKLPNGFYYDKCIIIFNIILSFVIIPVISILFIVKYYKKHKLSIREKILVGICSFFGTITISFVVWIVVFNIIEFIGKKFTRIII